MPQNLGNNGKDAAWRRFITTARPQTGGSHEVLKVTIASRTVIKWASGEKVGLVPGNEAEIGSVVNVARTATISGSRRRRRGWKRGHVSYATSNSMNR